jgi:DNA (cytosine-5)-methyltransferase 1
MDVQQSIHVLRELALFAGAGGGILGGKLLGWRTVCAVERDAYAAQVLAQRQNDGILEPFPIWSDVESFDGKPWRGIVDVVSGGFPCQDISVAGKGVGITGKRSGLWSEMARIIGEVRPRFAFIENSPALVNRGLDRVLADLASMGFDAEWGVLSAADVGAPHLRERIWIVAYSKRFRQQSKGKFHDAKHTAAFEDWEADWFKRLLLGKSVPYVCRENHDMADSMDRLKAIGNGQVPIVAATAFRLLSERAGIE